MQKRYYPDENEEFLHYLKEAYGLSILDNKSFREPQWDLIAKGITDYSFEGEDIISGKRVVNVTVLPYYGFDGKPLYDIDNPVNPFILANEPPSVQVFRNRFTGKMQKSCVTISAVLPSIYAKEEKPTKFLKFRALVDIQRGDEIFVCYGAIYDREYDINMDTECGCGHYEHVGGNLKTNVSRAKYEEQVKQNGEVPRELLNDQALRDSRVMKYFSKIRSRSLPAFDPNK